MKSYEHTLCDTVLFLVIETSEERDGKSDRNKGVWGKQPLVLPYYKFVGDH